MGDSAGYQLAADLVLGAHFAFVLFVVLGLVLILLGGVLRWRWVTNPLFRLIHVGAIVYVAIQSWLGKICPLTVWEMNLRRHAQEAAYEGSFIGHWLGVLLYWDLPAWVFNVVYSLFALAVLGAWYRVRPRGFSSRDD